MPNTCCCYPAGLLPAAMGDHAVRLKITEGQTLLTLAQIIIIFLVCLTMGNIPALAGALSGLMSAGPPIETDPNTPDADGRTKVILYYHEKAADNSGSLVYQTLYLTGSGEQVGLADAAGNPLLPQQYQDIKVLPQAYIVKQAGSWQFIDKNTHTPLNDYLWDEVAIDYGPNYEINSSLVTVARDNLYGGVDLQGSIIIQPQYDFFQTNSDALWPLILIKKDGYYGFISYDGSTIVPAIYDYAVLDSTIVYADENDATGQEIALIYVRLNGEWGAIYKEGSTASDVDWSTAPTEEVLAAAATQI
jgi:hypothetical protein